MPNENNKRYFWLLLNLVLAAIFVMVIFSIIPAINRSSSSQMPVRTMSVSAEGTTTAKPDLAQFSFSVVTQGVNLSAIATENNKTINAAIDFVKKSGVDEKDIKTTQYNLSPRYEYDEARKRSYISGYELTQSVLVKVRDLEKNIDMISKILGLLPEMGVNQISNISFTNEDPEKFLAEAREDGFEKAKEKAKAIAKANGVRLGKVVNISEYQQGPIYYGAYDKAMGMGGVSAPMAESSATIQPGTEELKIQVNVTYELR
jgi:hypothetical protein